MKTLFILLSLVSVSFIFNSCLKDAKLEKYTYYVPVYALKTEVQANIKSSEPQSILSPGKLYVQGAYIYLSEAGKGIHIIDYSVPSSPKNIAFIPIPGNVDLAVKGNYLYADEYADLLTIDITNPLTAKLVDVKENAFQNYYYGSDSNHIIASWQRVDTLIKSNDPIINHPYPIFETFAAPSASKANTTSTGGSTSRFTILNNHLYTVSNNTLLVFTIAKANQPAFVQNISANAEIIETIYPFKNNLFLGCKSGVLIYDASNADNPVAAGSFGHITECDPVIAEDNVAYATLRSGGSCMGENNELEVLNTINISNPTLIKTYSFTNPRGLAKEGDNLFICDGQDGLKILNAADANNITLTKTISGFEANDVIVNNGIAIVVATNGLYFIDYNNINSARVVGKL